MRNQWVILVFALCLLGSGCAFGTRRPVLSYTVTGESQPNKNINIYVEQFKDDRLDQDVIGHVRNGWGMKTAKVVTTTNISSWVTEALKAELSNVGYNVVETPNMSNVIGGEVIKVYCDSYMSYDGEVGIEVDLSVNGKEIYSRKYLGKNSSMNFAARAKSYGKTLEKALQTALIDATHDIDRELNNP